MKAYLTALLFSLLLSTMPARSYAQIDRGDLRLFFDTGLFAFTTQRVKGESPAGHRKLVDRQLSVGSGQYIGPTTGIGAGFAISRAIIPSFYFGFQRVRVDGERTVGDISADLPEFTLSEYELRPFLELAVRATTIVPYCLLGLSFVRRHEDYDGRRDRSSSGFGPAAGAGFHGFVSRRASIDLGVFFRALFIDDEDKEEALERQGLDDIKQRDYVILLTLGASVWL